MICKCLKYFSIGFFTLFVTTIMLAHIDNQNNTLEKTLARMVTYHKSHICYSHLIDNLKNKELLGENLNISRPCDQPEMIQKVQYYTYNFYKCLDGHYVGQPSTTFKPLATCRTRFILHSFHTVYNEFDDLFKQNQTITPTVYWNRFCTTSNVTKQIDEIKPLYNCL
jgi:hypothetical protein